MFPAGRGRVHGEVVSLSARSRSKLVERDHSTFGFVCDGDEFLHFVEVGDPYRVVEALLEHLPELEELDFPPGLVTNPILFC